MPQRKKIALLLIISFMILFISGCWSRKEIETLAFVTMIGLDKEGDDTLVTVQIALPQGGGEEASSGDSPVWTVTGRGRTVGAASRELTRFVGREIFFQHARVIIIGEELAKEGIKDTIDFLSRTPNLRGTHWFAVAKGKASDIMKVEPKLTSMPAFYLNEAFNNAPHISEAPQVRLLDFKRQLADTSKCQPFAPVIHQFDAEKGQKKEFVEEPENQGEEGAQAPQDGGGLVEPPGDALSLEQTAVFNEDKLAGWLNVEETHGLLWIRGETGSKAIVLEETSLGPGTITMWSTFNSSKIEVKPKGDTVSVDIFISQEGNLLEQTVEANASDPKNIEIINREVADLIKEEVEAALFKLQKQLQTDITNIANHVRRQQPEIWEKTDWQKEFPKVEINVHVESNMRRTGMSLWPSFEEKPWREEKILPKLW